MRGTGLIYLHTQTPLGPCSIPRAAYRGTEMEEDANHVPTSWHRSPQSVCGERPGEAGGLASPHWRALSGWV